MYVSISDNIPVADPTCKARASELRLARTQCQVNKGRIGLFDTTPSLDSLAVISPELASDAATLLQQSEVGRASVVGAGTPAGSIQGAGYWGAVNRAAPRVQPLNGLPRDMNACGAAANLPAMPVRSAAVPTMPKAAPVLAAGGAYVSPPGLPHKYMGLAGVAAPWGDAAVSEAAEGGTEAGGLVGWVKSNPWLVAGLVGGLVLLATDTRGRRGY